MHLSDGFVPMDWCAAGYVLTAILVGIGLRRLREEDLPKIALMTAAFFVTSSIHVKMGPTSVHAVMTGLVGALLGGEAALAIFVGLLMQAMLLSHGGFTTLGINAVSRCPGVRPALRHRLSPTARLACGSPQCAKRRDTLRSLRRGSASAVTLMTSILLQGAVLYLAVSDMTGIAAVWVLVAHAVLAVIEGIPDRRHRRLPSTA